MDWSFDSHNIPGLLKRLGISDYVPEQWKLFIDSSKYSLKVVLLHNGNIYGSISVAHSTKLKETYEAVKFVLLSIKYEEHAWQICVDLKMVNFLLGQQSGLQSFPAFYATGTAGPGLSTGRGRCGLIERA